VDASEPVAQVAATLSARSGDIAADVYDLIVREIPDLPADGRVQALLSASVSENVDSALHILQHGIDVATVRAPVAAEEYARRLAQRDVPMAALLRSYRIGATRFQEWCLRELSHRGGDAAELTATALRLAEVTATYIDRASEQMVAAYAAEKGNWQRNLGAARASRVRALLDGDRVDLDAAETVLGYRLRRRHHVGLVAWVEPGDAGTTALDRLESAVGRVAGEAGADGQPIFVPQDESSAWAWLPFGSRAAAATPSAEALTPGIRLAAGTSGESLAGFRRTHREAVAAQAVALTAGRAARPVTAFGEVAPLALMSGSLDLVRSWVGEILGALADDDESTARLRATLRVFLAENGSFKATAERLTLHRNTVQYRIGKAREGLGRPVEENRLFVELALLAADRLGTAVLRPGPSISGMRAVTRDV
jgi:DNA-binding PucR family transcriptional regulator